MMDSIEIDFTSLPENIRSNGKIVSLTEEMFEQLRHLPSYLMKLIEENRETVQAIVIGTTVVAIICGGSYFLVSSGLFSVVKVGMINLAGQAVVKIGNVFTTLKPFLITFGPAVAITACTTSSLLYYRAWRKNQTDKIATRYNETSIELAIKIQSDESLDQYKCPILLEPSNFPVKVVDNENGHVWYFDQELLLDWYDNCVVRGIPITNPITRKLLPFHSRNDIIVDDEAKKFIIERKAFHQNSI